jgi:hypothetical protein
LLYLIFFGLWFAEIYIQEYLGLNQ